MFVEWNDFSENLSSIIQLHSSPFLIEETKKNYSDRRDRTMSTSSARTTSLSGGGGLGSGGRQRRFSSSSAKQPNAAGSIPFVVVRLRFSSLLSNFHIILEICVEMMDSRASVVSHWTTLNLFVSWLYYNWLFARQSWRGNLAVFHICWIWESVHCFVNAIVSRDSWLWQSGFLALS